jgi:hypothetical protein
VPQSALQEVLCGLLSDPDVVRAGVGDMRRDEVDGSASYSHPWDRQAKDLAEYLLVVDVRYDPLPVPVVEIGYAVS